MLGRGGHRRGGLVGGEALEVSTCKLSKLIRLTVAPMASRTSAWVRVSMVLEILEPKYYMCYHHEYVHRMLLRMLH